MKVFKNLFQRRSAPAEPVRRRASEAEESNAGEQLDVQYLDYEDLADTETSLKLKDIIRAKADEKLKK